MKYDPQLSLEIKYTAKGMNLLGLSINKVLMIINNNKYYFLNCI